MEISALFNLLPAQFQAYALVFLAGSYLSGQFCSLTHTPDPTTPLGKAYKVLEIYGGIWGKAKQAGLPTDKAQAEVEKLVKPNTETAARLVACMVMAMGMSACASQQTQQIVTAGCTSDPTAYSLLKAGEAIATIVDPATVAIIAPLNAVDAIAHPAVQAACATALPGSVPVPNTVQVTSVPVAAPVSLTTVAILPTSK